MSNKGNKKTNLKMTKMKTILISILMCLSLLSCKKEEFIQPQRYVLFAGYLSENSYVRINGSDVSISLIELPNLTDSAYYGPMYEVKSGDILEYVDYGVDTDTTQGYTYGVILIDNKPVREYSGHGDCILTYIVE